LHRFGAPGNRQARHRALFGIGWDKNTDLVAGATASKGRGSIGCVGQAEGLVRSGRAFLTETLRDAWATVTSGTALSWEQRGLLWLASTQVAAQTVQAVELLFAAAGASAIYASFGLERCLRDVRTAAQHICVTPTNFEIAGQLTLGLDIGGSVWSIDNRGDAQYITDRT
jgi:indole-3-acetate monooxygenase